MLFTLPRNMVYPALLPLMHTPRLPVVDWTDAPADLNGLFRFAENRNLVYARVPSHFKRSLPLIVTCTRAAREPPHNNLCGTYHSQKRLGAHVLDSLYLKRIFKQAPKKSFYVTGRYSVICKWNFF